MEEVKIFDNGLRLVVKNMPSVRSICCGIWVNAGSATEADEESGLSHFIEHMMFKGTEKLTACEIAKNFENFGASVNAFTGKEMTCYYFKSIDKDAPKCFANLCDIFFNSVFDSTELDRERKVIVEEINMVDDSPEDLCYDLLSSIAHKGHPLQRTILGTIENVLRFGKPDIKKYMDKLYRPQNMVIAFAGNITLKEAESLTEELFLPFCSSRNDSVDLQENSYTRAYGTLFKDFKQANILLSYPSIDIRDAQSSIQSCLNIIVGGCMGSRLFQEIREKNGLAYSIYSSPSRYTTGGSFNIALNINADNTTAVLDTVEREIEKIALEGITQSELEMAKSQVISSMVFSQESVQSVMLTMGKGMLLANEQFDLNEKMKEVESVSVEQVNNFANKIFTRKEVSLAYVGVKPEYNFERWLKGE